MNGSHYKKIGRDEGDGSRTETQGSFDKKYGGGVGEASKERNTILQNQGNKDRDLEQGSKEEGSKVEANFDFEKMSCRRKNYWWN